MHHHTSGGGQKDIGNHFVWIYPVLHCVFLVWKIFPIHIPVQRDQYAAVYGTDDHGFQRYLRDAAVYVCQQPVLLHAFWRILFRVRGRPASHWFGHEGVQERRRRSGKSSCHLIRPYGNDFRKRGCQCCNHRCHDNPHDEEDRLWTAPGRRHWSSCLYRRADHASNHGRGRFHHGGDAGGPI